MKTYDNLQSIFDDGLLRHSDLIAFWGKTGAGKSSLKAVFEVWFMQPRNARSDLKLCAQLCDQINQAGFDLKPPPDHLVFVNTFAQSIGPGLKRTSAYEFYDVDFGLPNDVHPTGLLCPVGKYSFDENQDLFDSHMGHLATFVSKAMELSRQPELFLMFALQRPMRLPQDIRELTTFIECVSKQSYYSKYGRLVKTEWICNIIYKNANLEAYLNSPEDKFVDKQVKFVFHGDIYRCYNPRYFLPMFYAKGPDSKLKETTLTLKKCTDTEFSPTGFADFSRKHNIDLPDTYRGKKKKEEKCRQKDSGDKASV